MVFPAEGSAPAVLKDAPAKVTAAIAAAARAGGAEAEVAMEKAAAAAKRAGCELEAPGCLAKVAASLDVDTVVVVNVAPADRGVFVEVDLAQRVGEAPPRVTWLVDAVDVAGVEAEVTKRAPELFRTGDAAPEPTGPPSPPPIEAEDPYANPPSERDFTPAWPSGLAKVELYSWIIAGGGVALIGVGGFFLFSAADKQDEIDGSSPETLADFQALEELEDQAASRALVGNILVGAGVVAVGAGVWLIIKQLRAEPDRDAVALSPALFDHGVGLSLTVVPGGAP